MNLKDFFATKENPPELFWSLVLEPGWVQAGIWYIKEGATTAEVISFSPPTSWNAEEELLGSVDAALSSCIQKLPEHFPEPQKTVFGVSSDWVVQGEIKEEYISKIKKICSELSLTPTGFVVLSEGIAHLFKSEEGAPLSAIVLGLGKENLEISTFKLGNLVGTAQVARSVSLVEDVVEGLSRFEGANPLPSRIIVFGGREGEVEEARDNLSKATWEDNEKVKFLHTPKVEILTAERKVLATSLAGAAEIANVSRIETKKEVEELVELEESNIEEPKDPPSPQEFGFVVGKDIKDEEREEIKINESFESPTPVRPIPQPNFGAEPIKPSGFKPAAYLEKTKNLFHSLYGKISSHGPVSEQVGKKRMTSLFAVIGVILVSLFSFWWFYPKASVSIYVAPKKFEEEFEITFDESGASDFSNNIVPGEILSASVSGDKTKSATGSKQVGDKAKGTLILRNGTSAPIKFPAGTSFISSTNLKFVLDNEASVSGAIDTDHPGTAPVNATAVEIGAEYNLAKDEIFKVGNYPKADVDAKSTVDFSGGSSREISAVSAEDRTKLEEDLVEELTENAKTELISQISPEKLLVDGLVDVSTVDESYNHKVGDEADSVKLSLGVDVKAVVVDREKLGDFVREKLKDKVPQGFVLRESQIKYSFEFEEGEDGKYLFKVTTTANFLPEIKQEEIIKQISGRVPTVVEKYLSSVPGYTRAEIKLSPHFPGRFGTLPRVKKNISIEVVAER